MKPLKSKKSKNNISAEYVLLEKTNNKARILQIEIGNYNINYCVLGKGQPLILLHGLNIGWGQWYASIPGLAKNFKIYALDLPGAGNSTQANFEDDKYFDILVDIVVNFVDKLKLVKPSVVGHSLGGFIALRSVLEKRLTVKKLVLVDSLGITDYLPNQYILASFKLIAILLSRTVFYPNLKNINSFFESVFKDKDKINRDLVKYYADSLASKSFKFNPIMLINRMSGFFEIKKEFVVRKNLSNIDCPTLIIHGKYDPIIPLKFAVTAANMIRNCKIQIMNESAHVPFIEQTSEFNKAVIDFLK